MSYVGLLMYDNEVDKESASFETYGSWTLPLANLADPRVGLKAQSANATAAATKFRINFGAPRSIRALALTHTNLTSAAMYRPRLFFDAYSTEVGSSDWSLIPGYPPHDPDRLGASIWHVYDQVRVAQYLEWEIEDESNPAGFVRLGRLYASACYEPRYNFEPDSNSDDLIPNTVTQNALGGAPFFNKYTPARSFRCAYPMLPISEMSMIRMIRRIQGIDKQVGIIPNPDDVENYYERNFIGTLKSLPPIALKMVAMGGTAFDVIETVP